jgi:hypothetical protein
VTKGGPNKQPQNLDRGCKDQRKILQQGYGRLKEEVPQKENNKKMEGFVFFLCSSITPDL